MKYEKVEPRKWNFNCAQSGEHPDWAFQNARLFVELAHSVGIEPWSVFPGTRQVTMEVYNTVSAYQLSQFAKLIESNKDISHKIDKVWKYGNDYIYVNYVGSIEQEEADQIPDFQVGDKLKHRVSDEIVEVVDVDDRTFSLRHSSGWVSRPVKVIVKGEYKLMRRTKS